MSCRGSCLCPIYYWDRFQVGDYGRAFRSCRARETSRTLVSLISSPSPTTNEFTFVLYNSKKQKGLLSLVPAQGFIFVSSRDLGAPEDIRALKEKAAVFSTDHLEALTSPALASGLQKQYELRESWFTQHHLAQAEWVGSIHTLSLYIVYSLIVFLTRILIYNGHQPIPGTVPVPGKRYVTLVSALMHPLSRGTVHIGSSDPLTPPLIDPNYYGNEADLDLLVHITKFTMKLVATPPMAGIVRSHVLPRSEVIEDEEKLRQYVKENCGPVFHPVGTAAMLPREDGGVVDSELRVYGTNNLRVVSSGPCFYLLGWLNSIYCTGRCFCSSNGIWSCTFLVVYLWIYLYAIRNWLATSNLSHMLSAKRYASFPTANMIYLMNAHALMYNRRPTF